MRRAAFQDEASAASIVNWTVVHVARADDIGSKRIFYELGAAVVGIRREQFCTQLN